MNIADLDKNFKIESSIKKEDIVFRNALAKPFRLYGVFRENNEYVRMPDGVAKTVNEGIHRLSKNTAGGRIRFITNSPYVAIKTSQSDAPLMSHMPLSGSCGFDLYVGEGYNSTYYKSFIPPINMVGGYESCIDFPTSEERVITINLPLYHDVKELYIGFQEGSEIKQAPDYKIEKPIVYYGSSITQGGCASRPGASYQAVLSRRYDANYINLGFSGNAHAEEGVINYIAGLDMSMFVYDYDHNSPSVQHYEATHEKTFLRIRETHPDIPIIMANRPFYYISGHEKVRLEIMKKTYENAKARGDRNVYMVENTALMDLARTEGTVDGCHPTDLGFFSMALGFATVMDKLLL